MTIRIGEFSRLARVTVKTLHLYDRLELLKPARTDEGSGYRSYSGDQLPRLHAILALKELSFSLDHVRRFLDEDLSPSQIRTMLELRRDEARQALETERERLAHLEARLRTMEDAAGIPGRYEVVVKPVVAARAASARGLLTAYGDVGMLFGDLRSYARRNRISTAAWISVWHDPEFREDEIDGEAAFVTDDPLPKDAKIRESTLPAVGRMACTVHHGSFATIGAAYAALLRWIEENGYRVAGPHRELYLRGGGDQDDPDYVTEVQFPVERSEEREGRRTLQKTDWRKELRHLYGPSAREVVEVEVPEMRFLMGDGAGDPNAEPFRDALGTLYAVSYALKFLVRERTAIDYAVSPAEGLWSVEDPSTFRLGDEQA